MDDQLVRAISPMSAGGQSGRRAEPVQYPNLVDQFSYFLRLEVAVE